VFEVYIEHGDERVELPSDSPRHRVRRSLKA
jgi:hypothetical protein